MKNTPNFSIKNEVLEASKIPKRFWKVSVESLHLSEDNLTKIRKWISGIDFDNPRDLLITGKPHSGKTSLACLVLKSMHARWEVTIAYVDLRSLVECHFNRSNRSEEDDALYELYIRSQVLVIDECEGHKNEGCFMALDFVYRTRLAEGRITIIVCDHAEDLTPTLSELGPKLCQKIMKSSLRIMMDDPAE